MSRPCTTDYRPTMAKFLILWGPNSNPKFENMGKKLIVPRQVLIVKTKIPQMLQNLAAQFVCPCPKVWDFEEKKLHWASVVRASIHPYSMY